jgi:hypothetical protein
VVRTDSGDVRELSQLSPTIEALVKGNYTAYWLIYPVEASEKLSETIETALAHVSSR